MKKICIGFLIIFCSALATGVFAQEQGKLKLKLNYNLAMPLGGFKNDYIANTSFRGGSAEISYLLSPKFALGLLGSSQNYYQKYGRQLYKLDDNQTVSAVLSNTLETTPVLVNGTITPLALSQSRLQPYASLGAGVNFINYRQYFGEFSDGSSTAAFTARAEAGLKLIVGKRSGTSVTFGANYNYTPYNKNGLSNLNAAGVNAGVLFPLK